MAVSPMRWHVLHLYAQCYRRLRPMERNTSSPLSYCYQNFIPDTWILCHAFWYQKLWQNRTCFWYEILVHTWLTQMYFTTSASVFNQITQHGSERDVHTDQHVTLGQTQSLSRQVNNSPTTTRSSLSSWSRSWLASSLSSPSKLSSPSYGMSLRSISPVICQPHNTTQWRWLNNQL